MHTRVSALIGVLLLSFSGTTTGTTKQNVQLQTIDGTLILHMPKGKALKVQFHDENGVLDGPPQTVALQQDLEDLKIELRKEFLGETEARTSADNALTASLLAESNARTSADDALTASLLAESNARTSADDALTASLLEETKARASAYDALTASLLAETKALASADDALTASLLAETKARTMADTSLTATLQPLKPFASIDTNSFMRKLTNLPNPGKGARKTYAWPALFNQLFVEGKAKGTTVFQSGATYILLATSSNGVHSHTYKMNLRIGGTTYGNVKYRYRIDNIDQVNGPWHGGCGSNPFNSIDTNSLRILGNACSESINLFLTRIA